MVFWEYIREKKGGRRVQERRVRGHIEIKKGAGAETLGVYPKKEGIERFNIGHWRNY